MALVEGRITHGGGRDNWRTPDEHYDIWHRTFRFDYDPAADLENHKCNYFSTLDGTYTIHKDFPYKVSDETGLERTWKDSRVFVNPPYSRNQVGLWVDKMVAERHHAKLIVALLPGAIGTKWYARVKATANHVEELETRVRFIHPPERCIDKDGNECNHELLAPGDSPPTGHVLAIYYPELQP